MNERVDIVMATYNGMPYIREQLQSILWQDYPQFRLLIPSVEPSSCMSSLNCG